MTNNEQTEAYILSHHNNFKTKLQKICKTLPR